MFSHPHLQVRIPCQHIFSYIKLTGYRKKYQNIGQLMGFFNSEGRIELQWGLDFNIVVIKRGNGTKKPCCNLNEYCLLAWRTVHESLWYILILHHNYFSSKLWYEFCSWTMTLFSETLFYCIIIMIILNVVIHPGAGMRTRGISKQVLKRHVLLNRVRIR